MAATDGQPRRKSRKRASAHPESAPAGALLAAALALPGVMPAAALAQSAPDKGIFELQYLSYRDWQPGRNRMTVDAPAFYALMPVGDTWVVEGGMVYDAMSGASPLYFNVLSGASIGDYRTAGDLKVTKYFGDYAVSVGGFVSSEQDFLSRGGSVNVQFFSDDRNRTWLAGLRRHQRPHQRDQRHRAQLEAQLARVRRRRHAGAVAEFDRPVEPHVLHGPRLLLRPVQAARHAADRRARRGVAHALQPVLRRTRTRR